MSTHGYILIGKISFPYKAPGVAAQGLFSVSLPPRERCAVGARCRLPGDRAVSWPCRWHGAPDDDSLLYGVESVIAALTTRNVGFTVGAKAKEVELYTAEIPLKKRQDL